MPKKLDINDTSVDEAIKRFSSHWDMLPDELRYLAEKVTMLTAYAGGRSKAARAMGVGVTTLDNYRAGKTQPKFLELLKLARAADHDFSYLVAGSELQEWAQRDILERGLQRDWDLERSYDGPDLEPVVVDDVPVEFDPLLLERLSDRVSAVFKALGQKAPQRRITREAGMLYNALAREVTDLDDVDLVEATLPRLELEMRRRIERADAEPGTGKRSAS